VHVLGLPAILVRVLDFPVVALLDPFVLRNRAVVKRRALLCRQNVEVAAPDGDRLARQADQPLDVVHGNVVLLRSLGVLEDHDLQPARPAPSRGEVEELADQYAVAAGRTGVEHLHEINAVLVKYPRTRLPTLTL